MLENPSDAPPKPETIDVFVVQNWVSEYARD